MKTSFFSRFLAFSLAFYAGSVASVFLLTIVKTAVYFSAHFWSWLPGLMRGDVAPIILAELFRSPVMGLLFAFLGNRHFTRREIITWGVACGAFSYGVAYFFTMLSGSGRSPTLIEGTILGLPIVMVLVSRLAMFSAVKRPAAS